jgi:hypothetical protein
MAHIVDDIARILATPVPRRQAFQLVGRVLAGAFVGALGMKAQSANSNALVTCGFGRCASSQCCNQAQGAFFPFCASKGKTCCGNSTMTGSQKCCRTGVSPFVMNSNQSCCGNGACNSGHSCCPGGSRPFCMTDGKYCCVNNACENQADCCNGVCCGKNQTCVRGVCKASAGS